MPSFLFIRSRPETDPLAFRRATRHLFRMGSVGIGTSGIVVLSALLLAFPVAAEDTHELTVDLSNPRNKTGQMCVALFRDARGYPDKSEEAVARQCIPMSSLPWRVKVPAGTYAAAVFHDEDGDGVISKRFLGMPKEGYGFSNDPSAYFGPPTWEKASFELVADRNIMVHLTYY